MNPLTLILALVVPLLGVWYIISSLINSGIRYEGNDESGSDFLASLPPLWDKVPGNLSAFPLVDNITVIDPWDYRQRLAIYKIMVLTTEPYMKTFGPGNTGNILWGLPLQHGWQLSTGRLRDFSNVTKCGFKNTCISEDSWWASMNYFLSVIPFLGSVNAGLYSKEWPHPIRFTPSKSGRYCTTVTSCASLDALKKWTDFFSFVMNSTDDASGRDGQATLQFEKGQNMSKLEDKMLGYMWAAHVDSISDGVVRSTIPLPFMSQPEQGFGQDWGSMVGFIAATHFQTNFNETNIFQHMYLPPRILWPGDKPPSVPDFTKDVNDAVYAMRIFRKVNKASGGLLLRMWERAMCSPEGRKEGRHLMTTLVEKPYGIPLAIGRLLWDVMVYSCDDSQ